MEQECVCQVRLYKCLDAACACNDLDLDLELGELHIPKRNRLNIQQCLYHNQLEPGLPTKRVVKWLWRHEGTKQVSICNMERPVGL